jgi:hypothetical protein
MGDAGCAPWTRRIDLARCDAMATHCCRWVRIVEFADDTNLFIRQCGGPAAACYAPRRLLQSIFRFQLRCLWSPNARESLRRVWRRYSATGGVSTSANAASSSADATHPSCCVCTAAAALRTAAAGLCATAAALAASTATATAAVSSAPAEFISASSPSVAARHSLNGARDRSTQRCQPSTFPELQRRA